MKLLIDPELQHSLQMFSRFFDLIHQPLAIINREGKYIYYNQESADIDGYTIQQALGKRMLDVYPDMAESQSTMLQALKYGVEYIDHYQTYTNAKGMLIDYQHTTVPLYSSHGKMLGVIEIGKDLSNVRRLQKQVVELNQLLYAEKEAVHDDTIVTRSAVMQAQIDIAKRIAINDFPVIIVGETGTGKELFARLIHRYSRRKDKPFIVLNCAALPATLIESTLFGTIKGAFTGAENTQGYLELANGGTLFLDELNAMPVEMQSKLLRFLQDKTFWKLGGNKQLSSDVRIVSAMNELPSQLIQEGRLRADLFYRLDVGLISLPPLRSRPEDIALLANYFVNKYKRDITHKIEGISDNAMKLLQQHQWPGNVRMLENTIVRSMVMQMNDGPLQEIIFDSGMPEVAVTSPIVKPNLAPQNTHHDSLALNSNDVLPHSMDWNNMDFNQQIEQFEQQLIIKALNLEKGRIAQAAKRLNLTRTTLHYKIKKYNIQLGVQSVK